MSPPLHMPIAYGPVISKKVDQSQESSSSATDDDVLLVCSLCNKEVKLSSKLTCLSPKCVLVAHVICLANKFRTRGYIIPVGGECPMCGTDVLWGDLIRKKKGCFKYLTAANRESDGS